MARRTTLGFLLGLTALAACGGEGLTLNGSWAFRFEEDRPLEAVAKADFVATDAMVVPGCYDVMPKWYLRHGTGLYRRTFELSEPMKDAVLVVDGMGIRVKFEIDGRDHGVHPYPYARLEIPVGPLAAGTHTVFAAVDNILEWPRVKLARPYYDFYFYGGFYHGVKLVERAPKVFVRTLDYRTGTVEVEVVCESAKREGQRAKEEGERTLVFDGRNAVKATFRDGKAMVRVPDFTTWSPDAPNLHSVSLQPSPSTFACAPQARFGIRQVEARNRKIYLNGKEVFLKGFNRHESEMTSGAATSEALMLQDLQRLKSLGGNFIRGAHYQQCERFLDLCDEMGVLVWEESLGWGNGSKWYTKKFAPSEPGDPEFCDMQERQTREMVRASFNHPSVIISGFLNECGSDAQEVRVLVERLVRTIRAENAGHLVTYADCFIGGEICCSNLDIIAFNAYPGGLNSPPGTSAMLREKIEKSFNGNVRLFRERYPDKPIMVSESGCGGLYGMHDPNASLNTEEFQDEYLRDIFETLWANPDVVGFSIWQMNDGRTRERHSDKTASAMFGGSIAGVFDPMRRPKLSAATVRRYFNLKK